MPANADGSYVAVDHRAALINVARHRNSSGGATEGDTADLLRSALRERVQEHQNGGDEVVASEPKDHGVRA